MPLYEYECDAGHITEAIYFTTTQKAPKVVDCATCKGQAYKIMSASTAIFKGAGFDKKNTNERRVKL